ncbi:ATP-dependent endonuclease [Isoptericola cucumis]
MTCEFPGRFSLVLGPNGAGKTTINDAIYWAHTHRFPRLQAPDAAALGTLPRSIDVSYSMEENPAGEGALGQALKRRGLGAPTWSRGLERSLGRVRAATIDSRPQGLDQLRLVYLPALRNPVDDLSRRESRVLLELLRAEQLRDPSGGGFASVRNQAESLLSSLTKEKLIADVEGRIAQALRTLTGGVREHHAFIGTQRVDDAYLARVLEILLGVMPDPRDAVRLEAASLGYVNLLHIAVTLAGIPDPSSTPLASSPSAPEVLDAASSGDLDPDDVDALDGESAEGARRRIAEADLDAELEQDTFFPDTFHATVLIEEPEAHLHPQLQQGLIRYLRQTAMTRPDLQVIVSTHASDLISACRPEDLVIVRRDVDGTPVSRAIASIPWPPSQAKKIHRMTRLHLDASRSSALFAERVVLVEGITEAALLREVGRAWAMADATRGASRLAFVDALSIVPLGNRVGDWPVRLLATPGHELVSQVAVLSDTDLRPAQPGDSMPAATPPPWHSDFADPTTFQVFWSQPTLEPTLVPGNETLIDKALTAIGRPLPTTTDESVDQLFHTQPGKGDKAEFALELAAAIQDRPDQFVVPTHLKAMFDWLFRGQLGADTEVVDDDEPPA